MALPEVRRELVRVALPVIGLNLLGVLSLAIDMAMCGHLDEDGTSLAALGFATQIVLTSNVIVLGLTVGAVALIARAHGAGEPRRVAYLFTQSLLFVVLAAILFSLTLCALASPLLEVLGARGEVHRVALDYLRPMLGFAIFFFVSTLLAGAMRAVGRTFLPFLVALVSTLVHVVLGVLFIHGVLGAPRLGVSGAALAAIVSQALAALALVALVRASRIEGLAFDVGRLRVDKALARSLFRLGMPAALDMLIIHGAFLVIVAMLAPFGDEAVAANAVGLRVQSFAFVPGLAISQAVAAIVGASLGASDVARARRAALAALVFSLLVMSALGLSIVLFADALLQIFHVREGAPVHALARTWMQLLALSLPIAGANITLIGVLRGAGATSTSLLVNVLGTVLVQLPLGYLLAYVLELGTLGVWLAVPSAFLARLSLAIFFYRRGAWARVGRS